MSGSFQGARLEVHRRVSFLNGPPWGYLQNLGSLGKVVQMPAQTLIDLGLPEGPAIPSMALFCHIGAQKRTRTSTPLRTQAPEACASTNSATWAGDVAVHYIRCNSMSTCKFAFDEVMSRMTSGAEAVPLGMPCMVDTAIPSASPVPAPSSSRACAGGDIARSIAAFTLSSAIGFFPGGRLASRGRPSTPSARKRSHQRHTACFDIPVYRPVDFPPICLSPVLPAARNGGGRTMSRFRRKWNIIFRTEH